MDRLERWIRLVPAAVLIGVAAHQIHLVETLGLSAWSGGGFGMFSTADAPATRHLHALVQRPGIVREVRVPEELFELERAALALPSDANLRTLASKLAAMPSPDDGAASGVQIQVWRSRFDPVTLAPCGEFMRGIRIPFGP